MNKLNFFEEITEGNTNIFVYKTKSDSKGPSSKQGVPFYNPTMQLNRDISILVCQQLLDSSKRKIILLDGLAASGIRGVRLANELVGDFEVVINDWDEKSYNLIEKNIEKHNFKNMKACNRNLNVLLSEDKFDYIDVDPFGSPVGFIDSALRSIKNGGIIACSATDTATLCGVYPKVCIRRYGAIPFHSVVMKEIGLRILLGFICRVAGVYDKGIEPIICYSTDHYFRVYIKVNSSISKANQSMNNFKIIHSGENIGIQKTKNNIGPMWLDKFGDKKTIGEILNIVSSKKLGCKNQIYRLLDILGEEADAPAFFYTTESIASFLKKSSPRRDLFFENLKKQGFNVYRTHFSPTGFKTDASINIIEKMFK
jgi:tRNA (guanine26-N2/guanine27-N2)-dimethyltransferase